MPVPDVVSSFCTRSRRRLRRRARVRVLTRCARCGPALALAQNNLQAHRLGVSRSLLVDQLRASLACNDCTSGIRTAIHNVETRHTYAPGTPQSTFPRSWSLLVLC